MTYFKNNKVVFRTLKRLAYGLWARLYVTFPTQKTEYLHIHYFKYVHSMQHQIPTGLLKNVALCGSTNTVAIEQVPFPQGKYKQ